MKIHCDKCGKYLGDYLYGNGGVAEKARIGGTTNMISMPDIVMKLQDNWEIEPIVKNTL